MMTEAVYIKYLDSPYHTDGDMIIGPCSMNWALGYQRVSANPVAIVTREQLTAEQLARTRTALEVDRDAARISCENGRGSHA